MSRRQVAFAVIAIAAVAIFSRKIATNPDVADVAEEEVPFDSCFNR
jgi:anti-sigma-K factor RskA